MIYEKEQKLLKHYNNYPHGGTTIRNPLVLQAIFNLAGIEINPGSNVLDLGCASGIIADNIRKLYGVNVTGVDFASSRIGIGRKERPDIEYIEQDLYEFVSTTDRKFNIIMLFDTIEHLEDPKALLKNAEKILSEDGKIFSKTPLRFPYEAHLQVFNDKADFDTRLQPSKSFEYGQSIIAIWE